MKKHEKNSKLGFMPILKAKYLIILALLGVLAIMAPSFVMDYHLLAYYLIIGFVALVVLGLHQHLRFQKLHSSLRPFIVVRILQVIVTLGFLALIYITFEMTRQEPLPYGVFLLIALSTVYQFYNIFRLATQAKKDFPERCDFC